MAREALPPGVRLSPSGEVFIGGIAGGACAVGAGGRRGGGLTSAPHNWRARTGLSRFVVAPLDVVKIR